MKSRTMALMVIASLTTAGVFAQDWPQWRGPNRDAKASDFKAPKSWPKELTRKWNVTVGEGVATPALVGGKLYVFSRQDDKEVARCLNAADGKELWLEKYDSLGASGPAQGFSGPRSSPAVASGKVVTIGVRGVISCLDAATGKSVWRKDDFKTWPNFFPSSSPMIVEGLVIAQLGGRDNGALVAYDLGTGNEKWKWNGPSPTYASPVLMTVGGAKLILAQTESKLIAVNAADGKLQWELGAESQGGEGGRGRGMGGGNYKAATPIVDGQTIIIAGRGVKAVKLEKEGDKFVEKELWNNPDKSVQFNTPSLRAGMLYGLTANNELFCLNAKDGTLAWSAPFPGGGAGAPRAAIQRHMADQTFFGQAAPGGQGEPGPRGPGAPGGPGGPGGRRGGMGGGMGRAGFGSIIDAGSVLLALTPSAQLIVFEPGDKEFKQLASYKVSEGQTHAHPVASGNRIFITDTDSVTLWTIE
jgi:outer membrane protein assembly factor BamB